MSEIEAQNRRRFYVYSSWIPVIPAGILQNSWNSTEFLDSGRNPRNLAGISGGMESIVRTHHMFTQKATCAATLGPFQIHSSVLRGMTSLSGSAYANPTPALTITSLTFGFACYTLLALNSPTNCKQLTLVSNWIFSCLMIGGTLMSP